MKKFSGYEPKRMTAREPIPVGGYVVKVLNVKEQNYDWGDVLVICFDVIEGDYKGFFKNDLDNQTQEDKKWKGTYRLGIPKDDGSERDGWTKNTFNGVMYSFEESNKGFKWDWDESKLKGLVVGALFRNKEWEFNGRSGWTTECCSLIPADDIRNNKFKMPKDKPLNGGAKSAKNTTKSTNSNSDFEEITDADDFPF